MLDNADIDRLKEIFVTRKECDENMQQTDDKIGDLKEDTAVIKTRLNMTLGILSAIGVAVLSVAIKLMFGG